MLLRKQPPPATPDSEYASYYVAPDGKAHFVDGVVDIPVHNGDPVPLTESGGDPTTIPDSVQLYTKDVSTITELFAMNGDGDVAQVTSAGTINTPSAGINTFFAGTQVSAAFDFTATGSPTYGLALLDLGQTLTVPLATWCLIQARISVVRAPVPLIGPLTDSLVWLFSVVFSDAVGDFTVRAAAATLTAYGGGSGDGYVFPYYLLPAFVLADVPSFPVLAPDAAVLIIFTGPPGPVFRLAGFVDATVFTIPDPIP
jgi:hypothetical protein